VEEEVAVVADVVVALAVGGHGGAEGGER